MEVALANKTYPSKWHVKIIQAVLLNILQLIIGNWLTLHSFKWQLVISTELITYMYRRYCTVMISSFAIRGCACRWRRRHRRTPGEQTTDIDIMCEDHIWPKVKSNPNVEGEHKRLSRPINKTTHRIHLSSKWRTQNHNDWTTVNQDQCKMRFKVKCTPPWNDIDINKNWENWKYFSSWSSVVY